MTFNSKEIHWILASLSVFQNDMEFVGQKETADGVNRLIERFLSELSEKKKKK